MLKALKIAMIGYGAVGILSGLAFILTPYELGNTFGYEDVPKYVPYLTASLGRSFIAASVFIIAAAGDPLQHISWVKFATLLSMLSVVTGVYSILRGYVDFGQAGLWVTIDAVFAVAFLALYPWREARRNS